MREALVSRLRDDYTRAWKALRFSDIISEVARADERSDFIRNVSANFGLPEFNDCSDAGFQVALTAMRLKEDALGGREAREASRNLVINALAEIAARHLNPVDNRFLGDGDEPVRASGAERAPRADEDEAQSKQADGLSAVAKSDQVANSKNKVSATAARNMIGGLVPEVSVIDVPRVAPLQAPAQMMPQSPLPQRSIAPMHAHVPAASRRRPQAYQQLRIRIYAGQGAALPEDYISLLSPGPGADAGVPKLTAWFAGRLRDRSGFLLAPGELSQEQSEAFMEMEAEFSASPRDALQRASQEIEAKKCRKLFSGIEPEHLLHRLACAYPGADDGASAALFVQSYREMMEEFFPQKAEALRASGMQMVIGPALQDTLASMMQAEAHWLLSASSGKGHQDVRGDFRPEGPFAAGMLFKRAAFLHQVCGIHLMEALAESAMNIRFAQTARGLAGDDYLRHAQTFDLNFYNSAATPELLGVSTDYSASQPVTSPPPREHDDEPEMAF